MALGSGGGGGGLICRWCEPAPRLDAALCEAPRCGFCTYPEAGPLLLFLVIFECVCRRANAGSCDLQLLSLVLNGGMSRRLDVPLDDICRVAPIAFDLRSVCSAVRFRALLAGGAFSASSSGLAEALDVVDFWSAKSTGRDGEWMLFLFCCVTGWER